MHISLGSRVYPQPQETVVDIPSEQPVREPQEPKGFQELTDVSCRADGGLCPAWFQAAAGGMLGLCIVAWVVDP